MKNTSVHISKLRRAKVKRIGLFENLGLKIIGYIDGMHSLPKDSESGWTSPHLDREARSYDEFSSKLWGELQIKNGEDFARLEQLVNSIFRRKALLHEAKITLCEAERAFDASRKKGEDKLTDAQVSARRLKEKAKKLAPLKSDVNNLQCKLISEIEEFSNIRNKIIEDNNSTRMICARVRDHIYQRLDIYWNAALRKHSDKLKMPVVPCIEIASHSEALYMEPHKGLMDKAEMFNKKFLTDEDIKKEAA